MEKIDKVLKSAHARPWAIKDGYVASRNDKGDLREIGRMYPWFTGDTASSNNNLVVIAVNHFEELLTALRAATRHLKHLRNGSVNDIKWGTHSAPLREKVDSALDMAQRVMDKIEGASQ